MLIPGDVEFTGLSSQQYSERECREIKAAPAMVSDGFQVFPHRDSGQ